jgi:hypothetical protein
MTQLATIDRPDLMAGYQSFFSDLKAEGYSESEIDLIGQCWQSATYASAARTQLAIKLHELKKEMDANDPFAGRGGEPGTYGTNKSRFWGAFEQGKLPLQGDKSRETVKTYLRAAEYLESKPLGDTLPNGLRNLGPSTICLVASLSGEALAIVEKQLANTDFIGIAAVRLIANEANAEVLAKMFEWVDTHKDVAITPKIIRELKASVDDESRPANTRTVDIGPILQGIRAEAPQREHHARVQAVKEELLKPDREHQQLLDSQIQAYSKALTTASTAVHELFAYMRQLSNVHGTELLDEMRATDYRGFITVADDMQRLQAMGKELMEVVQLAQTSNPPTGIDMTTVNV